MSVVVLRCGPGRRGSFQGWDEPGLLVDEPGLLPRRDRGVVQMLGGSECLSLGVQLLEQVELPGDGGGEPHGVERLGEFGLQFLGQRLEVEGVRVA